MTRANQIYSGAPLLINQKKFDQLSNSEKDIVRAAAKKAAVAQVKMNRAQVDDYYNKISASGVQVAEATDQLASDMRAAARKVWESPDTSKAFGQEVIDRILAEAK
jgi:TRAP-type C4-dicarboxylate transport system substrate-binding protein